MLNKYAKLWRTNLFFFVLTIFYSIFLNFQPIRHAEGGEMGLKQLYVHYNTTLIVMFVQKIRPHEQDLNTHERRL